MRDRIATLRLERHLAVSHQRLGRDDDEMPIAVITCEIVRAADDSAMNASPAQTDGAALVLKPAAPPASKRRRLRRAPL
jgi:hypothetical protein